MPDDEKTRKEQAEAQKEAADSAAANQKAEEAKAADAKAKADAEAKAAAEKTKADQAEAQKLADEERNARINEEVERRVAAIRAELAADVTAEEVQEPFSSETQRGGIYKTGRGKYVDANGRPVKPGEPNPPLGRRTRVES